MASISVVSARFWARHALAIEMATITAVAAAASLGMGGNLMINMFDVAVVTARAPLDIPAGGSAAGRSHHRRLHGGADVPRIGGGTLRRPGAPPQHALVDRE